MYKFQKLLKDNGISENDSDLPLSITRKIEKFNKIEASAKDADTDEVIEKRQAELDALDEQIMQTLPEYFELEDEAEINQKAQADNEAKEKANAKAQADKKAADDAAELAKPATTNYGALDKLYKQGKTTVSMADLKRAGFNTGFTSPIGINGCVIKEYELYRDYQYSDTFELSKK